MARILIVEDENKIARFVQLELEHEGYTATVCADGRSGLALAMEHDYDCIILDVMLPELNGLEMLRRLRQSKQTPVIILTARDQVMDKVTGLDFGADDYMTKPFAIEELLARIRTVLKRTEREPDELERRVGKLVISLGKHTVTYGDASVELTRKEFDLLAYLVEHKNKALTREQILGDVWGYDYYGDTNVVDVYVRYLRTKIDERFGIKLIQTLRGTGYIIKD